MKRKFLWLFLCCVIIVTLVAWSCGGAQNSEQEEEEEEEDGLFWADFPSYPGADRQYEAFSIFPSSFPSIGEEEYILEWRYYSTSDSNNDVITYYRGKMPEYGWGQTGLRDLPGYTYNTYSKNTQQEMAYVLVASDHGDTIIALLKGEKK